MGANEGETNSPKRKKTALLASPGCEVEEPATALKVSESQAPERGCFFPILSLTEETCGSALGFDDLEPGDRAGRAAPAGLLGGCGPRGARCPGRREESGGAC